MHKALSVKLAGRKIASYDVAVVGCFEREKPLTAGLPRRLASAVESAVDRPGWKAKLGKVSLNRSSEPGRPFVAVCGLGPRSTFDVFKLGAWLKRSANRVASDGYRSALFQVPDHEAAAGRHGALFVMRTLAGIPYRFDSYRARKKRVSSLKSVTVLAPAGQESEYAWARSVSRHLASGIALSRYLADTPPNVADPEWMAAQAVELAEAFGMESAVLGPSEMAERGMGGILAVGGGSGKEPRLVRLGWGEGETAVALVGKGVTFDSGGLSLKPAPAMDEMKFDKAGACTVLGIARALAGAKVPGRFSCYLPLAENMPGGESYRPGDIVTCANGKTVEILNTDAEGRMLLADALDWASAAKPDVVLDFATLTGACVVALGLTGAGLFAPSDELASQLLDSAARSGERLWRLPLWPTFEEDLEGRHADLKNVAGRWGGASSAAAFLGQFVKRRESWAHFDIAGPAWVGEGRKGFGATGYGVATTFDWLLRRAELI